MKKLIQRILGELKIPLKMLIRIYSDNKCVISIAHNSVLHGLTKRIEVDKHFIKEKIEASAICIPYLPTSQQIIDVLTKGLPKKQFVWLINKEVMNDIFKLT